MKTLTKLFALIILFILCSNAQAQNPLLKEILEKNSGKDGFSEIRISKKMLEYTLQSADMGPKSEKLNISQNFKSLVILVNESGEPFKPSMQDISKSLDEDKNYEQLMYMKDKSDVITVYTKEYQGSVSENKGKIEHFVLLVSEQSEQVIMSIEGTLSLKEIIFISNILDYDIEDLLYLD